MAEITDMEIGYGRTDVENVLIKIEMAVKSDTKQLDIVYQREQINLRALWKFSW